MKILPALLAVCAVPYVATAQTPKSPPVKYAATVLDTFGDTGRKSGREPFAPLRTGDPLGKTFTVRTGDDSAMLFKTEGDVWVRLGANSVVRREETGAFRVLSGQVWANVPQGKTAPQTVEIGTPSGVARTASGMFGVGYDLETDQTVVSVGNGAATVSLKSGAWSGAAKAGQFVQYLRNPQTNIRLRKPEIAAQPASHVAMWTKLRAEPWTKNKPGKLTRGIEGDLQQVLTQGVFGGEGNKL